MAISTTSTAIKSGLRGQMMVVCFTGESNGVMSSDNAAQRAGSPSATCVSNGQQAVRLSRTGPALRQSESCQRHTRGDSDPLDAVEHIGDRRHAPDGSTSLETPQLLATCGIKCIQIAVVVT